MTPAVSCGSEVGTRSWFTLANTPSCSTWRTLMSAPSLSVCLPAIFVKDGMNCQVLCGPRRRTR